LRRAVALVLALAIPMLAYAQGTAQKPNIVVIFGDDIGTWNVGAYPPSQGSDTLSMKKAVEEAMKKMESANRSSN